MTSNQLKWLEQQETERANRAKEDENIRSNKTKEAETMRSNIQQEVLKAESQAEAKRHNKVSEVISAMDAAGKAAGNIAKLLGTFGLI